MPEDPQSPTGIDWSKLTGQTAPPTSGTGVGIDWSKLPTVGGEHNPQTGTIEADQHPIEHRMNELVNDAKFGPGVNDDRLPERAMRAVGFHGTETGGQGGVGAAMPIAGAIEGVPELIHAATRVPQVKTGHDAIGVANEGMGGAMSTLAGAAPFIAPPAALPMVVPSIATGGAAGRAASGVAKFAGAAPDTQELIGNMAAVAVPAAHGAGEPVGKGMQAAAPALGKAAGLGTTAATMFAGKSFNPLDLLFSTPLGTRPATEAIKGSGKLIENLGSVPFRQPELPALDSTQGTTAVPPLISRGDVKPNPPAAGEILPPERQLPRGPLQMPPPAEQSAPIARPAQPAIVRNTNTGRMTKQFLPTESTGKPVYPEPLINTESNPTPKAPPNAPQTEVGLSSSALKNTPKTTTPSAEAPAASQSQSSSAPLSYKDHLDATIQEYQKLLELNPQDQEAVKALKDFTDLRDEISQPGYNNPLIDVNSSPQSNGNSKTEEPVPNPGGTATDTTPGVNKPTEINVKRLETTQKPGPQLVEPLKKSSEESQPTEDVKEGDFSLNTPRDFYHGSPNKNLINIGIKSRISPDIEDAFEDKLFGVDNPSDYKGVFLTGNPEDASMYGSVNKVTLPRGSSMRMDPMDGAANGDAFIHRGDIPSGAVNTPEDLIDTRGLLQQLRQGLESPTHQTEKPLIDTGNEWENRKINWPEQSEDLSVQVEGALDILRDDGLVGKKVPDMEDLDIDHETSFPINKLIPLQSGGGYDPKQIKKYSNDIQSDKPFEAITVINKDGKYYVTDGHHRIDAATKLGKSTIPATVITLPKEEK